MSAPLSPADIEASQQALDVLTRIHNKVLLELWTTIVLVAGMLSVAIAQLMYLFGLRRVGAFFVAVFGYAMTWVPAQIAPIIGYSVIVLAIASIVKESMGGNDSVPHVAKKKTA